MRLEWESSLVAENRGGGGGDSSQVSNLRNGRLGSLRYADNSEMRPSSQAKRKNGDAPAVTGVNSPSLS